MAVMHHRLHAARMLILLAFAANGSLPGLAVRHLTVAQFEKALESRVTRHRTDDEMVREFGDFTLTERLTDAARTRITTTLHLGPRTTLALQLLADESALLDPPRSEFPDLPAPGAAMASHMLSAATDYVTRTVPHLPDIIATRTTYSFDDTAQTFKVNEWPIRAGLHLTGNLSREITYRDDHEVTAPTPKTANTSGQPVIPPLPDRGLQSYGDFGQLLGVIFVDTQKMPPVFHHWEQTLAGPVAVFHYQVLKSNSHYEVKYCCLTDTLRISTRVGGRRGGGVTGNQQGSATFVFHKVPGYHGSLFIDPASGVILRMTLEAEMSDSAVSRAATVVEYGPVVIGDRKFTCPLRSMNIFVGPLVPGPPGSALPSPTVIQGFLPSGTLYLNETSYTNYHRLGSTIRILDNTEAPPAADP